MDPRDRADAVLERAEARRRGVVTPINATSPMDASETCRIRASVVRAAREDDPDTNSIPAPDLTHGVGNRAAEDRAAESDDPPGERTDELPAPNATTGPLRAPATEPLNAATDRFGTVAARDEAEQAELREREVDGLVPTVSQQAKRPSVVERLSGLD